MDIYSFTNKNYWHSNQGFAHSKKTSYLTSDEVAKYLTPETMDSETLINEYGYLKLTRLMGKEPTVTIEDKGVLVDDSGRYWVAVGPAVIFEEYPPNGSPGDEMYGNGTLDVVILDINKVPYYVRCVVGGIKAHTWDNGKIQTWKAYEGNGFTKGELYSAGGNYYGVSCVEFRTEGSTIGDLNYSKKKKTLGKYEIDKIIFYDNPIQPAE